MSNTEFEADVRTFMGTMLEFKATTERRLGENRQSLDMMNKIIGDKQYCPAHLAIIDKVSEIKTSDDKKTLQINELEKKTILIDYKLTLSDTAKISGISAVLAVPLIEIIRVLVLFVTRTN